MTELTQRLYQNYAIVSDGLGKLHSVASVAARLYIAQIFFSAGLTKIRDWDTTLFLFEEEYHVPFIPFELAAYLGTLGELVFPVLLFAGLFTRFSALSLSVVNIIAVISLAEIAPAAFYLHVIWGVLLAQLAVYGGGVLSADHWIRAKLNRT
ncbi:Uncharacterised protein [BD1-7 clade bacterium]|uniref:DoxX family protein n=1 Tax=BD1-7 clade bacterium TaxID=2029982 RepID=A0A5S9QSK1_9GAMM|nr:Uncharacterised protein [BD1-7 clade bacterium]CAA0122345.1 Uncharacterised protein [BD1-7 clade bacterium]